MRETYSALMNSYTKDRFNIIFDVRDKKATIEDFKNDVRDFCKTYYPTEDNVEEIAQELVENLFGYSILTPLIENKDISDIKVHDWDNIIIKTKGKKTVSDVKFNDVDQYNRFIESVITRNKVNASTLNAIQRFTDDDSFDDFILRFTLVTPFLTTKGNYELIIRKVPKNFYSMDNLVTEGMMSEDIKDMLIEAWKKGSILICGANSSGKTTILNALKEEIPHDKSVLVIQQAEELSTKDHPDMIFLHSIEGSNESEVKYTLKELSIAGLTMDVEYFIIGEIKGAEACYLLNASYTGQTCAGTIHANDSENAIDKLVDYALDAGTYTKSELMRMMTCFKTVVFMKDFKVQKISEVTGVDNSGATSVLKYKTLYEREAN